MIEAMQKGNETSNPTATKRKQIITNAASLVVSVGCLWVKGSHPELPIFEYQDDLTAAFITIVGFLNYYFTVASSKKVGPVG